MSSCRLWVLERCRGGLQASRLLRLPKVWLHVALSVLVMNAAAVGNAGLGENVRKYVA